MAGLPGRDRRAVRHPAVPGAERITGERTVAVIGGGIAGLTAAVALAERGVGVIVLERSPRLGGRASAWPLDDDRTMSRGFHAFFRQYYNLRALLRRIDPELRMLQPVEDYPLVRAGGHRDSFAGLPRTPPWSVLAFVARSPSFTPATLARVDVRAALELLQVRFPDVFERYAGESAAQFLDRLRFPDGARHLALEVFARSFFADPTEFAAGELVAMFHTYFVGSAEGLLFDEPDNDYDSSLWAPLGRYLHGLGVEMRTDTVVERVRCAGEGVEFDTGSGSLQADAAVVATDPRAARTLLATLDPTPRAAEWQRAVAATRNAPPFVVVRLWLDGRVRPERPAFLGTAGYGPLDNVSVLERFESGAARWSAAHDGSVVELHGYAADPAVARDASAADEFVAQLETELHRIYQETATLGVRHREVLVADDCGLIGPDDWTSRPGVVTPWPQLRLAGDWVRCDLPVALMERAATTGLQAANGLLARWGVRGHDLWTVPMRGLLGRAGSR